MNENLNLYEILKGCEGIELYCTIAGPVKLIKVSKERAAYPIQISCDGGEFGISANGLYWGNMEGSECILFPSKTQRDWSKFVKPIPKDTPFMVRNNDSDEPWALYYYSHYDAEEKRHYVFTDGDKERDALGMQSPFEIMIPYDKFDPMNIEESLKYNIQK